ncbi:MAG TPA: hypothetical protein VG435_05050 [Acidimicrobiales bacterium]|nr:hypothetical protein [Acidimicrobiales bacterium]
MLLPADESFNHQIVETAAYVATSDRSWTEKVCAMAASRDGRFQLGFGVGKYTNRNVFDGYAGLSVGRSQWVVRSSRRLADDPGTTSVGPIRYEVVEPLKTVRFALAGNDAQPLSFEWTFSAVTPTVLEQRDHQPSRRGYRTDIDILRYHQVGVAEGWFSIGGERTGFGPEQWFSTRDHSWGVRQDVGLPETDIEGAGGGLQTPGVSFRFSWSPMLLERPDGSAYAIHHQHRQFRAFGWEETRCEGTVEHTDGRLDRVAAVRPELRFDPANRRVLGGTIHLTMADGTDRPLHVEAMGDTGFHLGLGLYFGLDGHHHGEWRGPLHVEGEHVEDCTDAAAARRIHQIRDAVMRVDDPVGGGHGWGNLQTAIVGAWPDQGLDEESSFV